MNRLFYNIGGAIVHKIRREKRTTISEVIVRGKQEILSKINKIGIGFMSIFLLKARVSYLTILKRKNLSLPLKDGTEQSVICLILPECLCVKIAFYPRTVKRIVTALMPSFLFHCFSVFLPHLRTLALSKGQKIVFVLLLVGRVSVCIYYCFEI